LQFGLPSLFGLTLATAIFLAIGREYWSHPLFAVLCQAAFGLVYVAGIGLAASLWLARTQRLKNRSEG
jgi:hypothetical protein